MVISISAAVLTGLIAFALIRGGAMRATGAITAALFGFFLASTGLAPVINDFIHSTISVLSSL